MEIRYLERDEIDTLKWDSCIHYATNGNPYGFSWYLDNSTEYWSGLVEGDYESVFPLVYNRKLFGIRQLYQPYFCQQLGLYSVRLLSKARIKAFLDAIPRQFRYINIQVNERTHVPASSNFSVNKRSNYVLLLKDSYEDLYSNYSSNLKRNLKKAAKSGLVLTNSLKPETLVDLYRTHQAPKIKSANEQVFHMAHRIIYNALHRGRGFLSGVKDQDGNLLAAGFFLTSHQRIINLIPSTTDEGRNANAMHFMLDTIIRMQSGKPVMLDFEGSSVPSIARFFQSFGSTDVPYYQISRNHLPFYIKWYKRS